MTGALASSEAQLRRFAFEDQLTGLPNRQALLQRIRWWPTGALVYVRLDSIADVASMLGFEAADEVILSVGQRLKALAADEDLVGRVADGSFALFFPSASSAQEALDRMSGVLGMLESGLTVGDADIEVVAHAGAALCPDDSADPETLLRLAELAARGANRSDRGTMFDASADAQKAENLRLLSEMRTALLSDAFDLVYQPIVKLDGTDEVHFEALIRWTGDDGVRRSPAEFIPLAERTGAIAHIDRWVLDRVGRQIQEWGREGFRPAVSVNLSAHSLLNEDLPAFVDGLIEAYQPEDRQLCLEITETAFIEGFEGPLRVCEALAARGLPIAIDDFGMGYAPILYLRSFPVDALKVDMSVTRDLGHDPAVPGVIQGIVQMAEHFRISTVAEGVETPETDAALRKLGVSDAYGYLYGRPMSPREARMWARTRLEEVGA
ncbi:MAG: GGDEF domain-containing protein [Chloroflexi bacterium]|nr:GGDEF domain-containing protein [Chloroflexota bacterium]